MPPRLDEALWSELFRLDRGSAVTLQAQIRTAVVRAVLDRRLPAGSVLPPTRVLAAALGVGRNTALLAYRQLVDDGLLIAEPRSGHVVAPNALLDAARAPSPRPRPAPRFDWARWLRRPATAPAAAVPRAATLRHVGKAADWQRHPYPFVYGQFDPTLFPLAAWREADRLAVRRMAIRDWAGDRIDSDDPELLDQLRSRVLSRRGIWAASDEILITLGAQQAMFIVALLLAGRARRVGVEDPGYPDLRNTFRLLGVPIRRLPLDRDGLRTDLAFPGCDVVCVSPSHQNPTSITMPLTRRRELLAAAERHGGVVVEDDYDSELAFGGEATPALKALDRSGRVVYIGSLSKTIAPGLRAGYLIAPAALIAEARAIRRLMLRHPPANNQRTLALFLALGHHDTLVRSLVRSYRGRAEALCDALRRHLPGIRFEPPRGGSALWLRAPDRIDMRAVRQSALAAGVVFDSGEPIYAARRPPLDRFR
ncbi:MAG: PLP-dependent aminotransferase family protein, partial [Lautropia sp.]